MLSDHVRQGTSARYETTNFNILTYAYHKPCCINIEIVSSDLEPKTWLMTLRDWTLSVNSDHQGVTTVRVLQSLRECLTDHGLFRDAGNCLILLKDRYMSKQEVEFLIRILDI